MVNGMDTEHILLCFLVAKEISKTPPLYEFNVKYNVWATVYKEKKTIPVPAKLHNVLTRWETTIRDSL